MPISLLDPVLFLIAVPVFFYTVCLAISLVSLFPSLQLRRGKSDETVDVELRASLQQYASLAEDPVPKRNRLSEKNEPAIGAMTGALGRDERALETEILLGHVVVLGKLRSEPVKVATD